MLSLLHKLLSVCCDDLILGGEGEDLLPGATIISFFLERIRRKVRSFWGSISRTVLRAFKTKLCMRLAYCVVVGLSMVLLIGMPEGRADRLSRVSRPFPPSSQPYTPDSTVLDWQSTTKATIP